MAVKSVVLIRAGGSKIKRSETSGGEAVVVHVNHSGAKTVTTTGVGGGRV